MMPDVIVDDDGRFSIERNPASEMVLPGFVNVHSHAFQRCLRGRVESRSKENPNDDFWSWRDAMYAAANAVSVDDLRALARWCYLDMVRAGVTAVGEFHYLHHLPLGGGPRRAASDVDPLESSRALVEAAADVGLHLTLLETAYARAGHGREATAGQQRFIFGSVEAFLFHVDNVRKLSSSAVNVGVAVHSVRACPRGWIEAIAAYAKTHALPLHVHACEQRREIAECREEHGMTPIALLDACGALTKQTTLVHATHLDDDDIARIAASGATVCLTPSTERNLGDGLCRIADLHTAGVPLCVGSDSHARIDLVDELRSVEDHERLRTEKRCVLVPPGGRLGPTLVPLGTRNGARALGLGDNAPGNITVPMPVEGRAFGAAAGLDAFFVGGSSDDVSFVVGFDGRVCVNGDEFAARDADVEERALSVLRKLLAR